MIKKISRSIKTVFAAVFTIIMALCFGLVTFGCGNDESQHEYITRIVKEKFGCEKILWYAGGVFQNEVSSVYLYLASPYGYKSLMPYESVFDQPRGGSYVVGVDKHGYELFIAIPDRLSTEKNSKKYSPRVIQWPFAYSFTEIATFAAEHGYQYADGIDVGEDEKQIWDFYSGSFAALNNKDNITRHFIKLFDDADKKYDELDIKFVLYYRVEHDKDNWTDNYVMQKGGKLMLYQCTESAPENINIVIYERNFDKPEN